MKTSSIALICAALAIASPAITPTQGLLPALANPWVGLWQASPEAQPVVILTLADDSGRLIVGIFFNTVSNNGPPRIPSHHTHGIMNLRVEGYTLRLVLMRQGDRLERERPPA